MTRRSTASAFVAAAVLVCAAWLACRPADAAKAGRIDTTELAKRAARLDHALGRPDSSLPDSAAAVRQDSSADTGAAKPATDSVTRDTATDGAIARWILPRELDEISGIALTSDGGLLAHGDERAQVSVIDYRRGVIVRQFVVGHPTVRADLEGIAIANDVVFLLTSKGTLYEFREGANGTRVDYIESDTRLGSDCEFEGLAFDPAINSLLLACKEPKHKRDRDSLVIYRWKLAGGGERLSRLVLPLSSILPSIKEKEFHPADIAVDPRSGNYVIIASIEKALVEITPDGAVVSARKLAGQHTQPESIAITKDGVLIIGDEAGKRPAALTLYPWPL